MRHTHQLLGIDTRDTREDDAPMELYIICLFLAILANGGRIARWLFNRREV